MAIHSELTLQGKQPRQPSCVVCPSQCMHRPGMHLAHLHIDSTRIWAGFCDPVLKVFLFEGSINGCFCLRIVSMSFIEYKSGRTRLVFKALQKTVVRSRWMFHAFVSDVRMFF